MVVTTTPLRLISVVHSTHHTPPPPPRRPQYSEMMDPAASPRVNFTMAADAEVVKFIFYRTCFGLLHSFSAEEWQGSLRSYASPSEAALLEAEARLASAVGAAEASAFACGRPEYYLHLVLQPQQLIAGVAAGKRDHAEIVRSLLLGLLVAEPSWRRRGRWPLCVSGCDPSLGEALRAARRTRCLAWAAQGVGWQSSLAQHSPQLGFRDLCQILGALPPAARPEVVVVVMAYGARLAAQTLLACGASRVVWVQASMQSADEAPAILEGCVLRVLETLEQPVYEGASAAQLSEVVVKICRQQVFGGPSSGWAGAGVLLGGDGRYVVPPPWVGPTPGAADGKPMLHRAHADSAAERDAWMSDIASVAAAADAPRELHEEIMVTALEKRHGKPVDLMKYYTPSAVKARTGYYGPGADSDEAKGFEVLCEWLEHTLPKTEQPRRIAALFADETVDEHGRSIPQLQVRLHVPSVGFLHELRDLLLDGKLDRRLEKSALAIEVKYREASLGGVAGDTTLFGLNVSADRVRFATRYEQSVLSLDKLTAHQHAKLRECRTSPYVHLMAPAGAGKTFVANNRIREVLEADRDAVVLFVARNEALCVFVAHWLCRRLQNSMQRLRMLRRVHLLFAPLAVGVRTVTIEEGRLVVSPRADPQAPQYALMVVDEAHHIYSDATLAMEVEEVVRAQPPTRRLLLSDVSQSIGRPIAWPCVPGVEPAAVRLSEVVRNTQRIVLGAAAFELSPDKAQTTPQHGAVGPPLKSFIFQPAAGRLMETYASYVLGALDHVMATFGESFVLDNRVAIIVPDAAFLAELLPHLEHALRAHRANRFKLVSARDAASILTGGLDDYRAGGAAAARAADGGAAETLVVDELACFDGLERLVVVAVGLDAPITPSGADDARQTRSALYRAITRAQMLAVVVNSYLSDGWLAFLGHVKLRPDDRWLTRPSISCAARHHRPSSSPLVVSLTQVLPINLSGSTWGRRWARPMARQWAVSSRSRSARRRRSSSRRCRRRRPTVEQRWPPPPRRRCRCRRRCRRPKRCRHAPCTPTYCVVDHLRIAHVCGGAHHALAVDCAGGVGPLVQRGGRGRRAAVHAVQAGA